MKMTLFLIVLTLCNFNNCMAFSQDQFPAHFDWLPGGDYSSVTYCHLEKLKDNDYFKRSQEASRRASSIRGGIVLPSLLDELAIAKVSAVLVRLEEEDHYAAKRSNEQQKLMEAIVSQGFDQKVTLPPGKMVPLYVFRLDISVPPLEKLKKAGLIEPTDKSLGEYKVFKLLPDKFSKKPFYAFLAEDELVISGTTNVLRSAYEAKFGLRSSFEDACVDYLSLKEYFIDLPDYWVAGFGHAQTRVNYDNMIRDGLDKGAVEAQREQSYSINPSLTLQKIDLNQDNLVVRIQVFRTNEEARSWYERAKQEVNRPGPAGELARLLAKDPDYLTLDDNVIRRRILYTDEIVDLEEKQFNQAMERLQQYFQNARKSVEAESGNSSKK